MKRTKPGFQSTQISGGGVCVSQQCIEIFVVFAPYAARLLSVGGVATRIHVFSVRIILSVL